MTRWCNMYGESKHKITLHSHSDSHRKTDEQNISFWDQHKNTNMYIFSHISNLVLQVDSDPQQSFRSIRHMLPCWYKWPHLRKPTRVLKFTCTSSYGKARVRAPNFEHPEKIEAITIFSALHHRRESHHLGRPVSRTRNVYPPSLPQRLRPQLWRRCQNVIDNSDCPEPQTQPVGSHLQGRIQGRQVLNLWGLKKKLHTKKLN